ncbi:MAG TPA: hypothetical protein EYP77_03935 [Anaerolineae bacterium]|nr:hypothetical protein [Anaerolineae bacterium]
MSTLTPIGHVAGTAIAVRTQGAGQEILVSATGVGRALVQILAENGAAREEDAYLVLSHDQEVDRRLKELADALVAIRYTHPTLVQLTLELGEENDGRQR